MLKSESITLITVPLNLETKHQLTIKPRRRSLVHEQIKKSKNIQKNLKKLHKILKKLLEFVILIS